MARYTREMDMALDTSLLIEDPINMAIQELDLLLGTECTELIGTPYYGVSMEQFLWTLTPNVESLKTYLYQKIEENTYWCHYLNIGIDVNIVEGTIRNIYEISLDLTIPEDYDDPELSGKTITTKKYVYK